MTVVSIQPKAERRLSLSCGLSAQSGSVSVRTYTWEELVAKLQNPTLTQETEEEYRAMKPKDKERVKDVGYFIGCRSLDGRRASKSFRACELIALDADKAPKTWADELKKALPGLTWAAHTTHSHRAKSPRVRILVPVCRPILSGEHAFISRHLAGVIGPDWFDPSGFRMTQPMFWPSCPADGEYVFETGQGSWLDPDVILSAHPGWEDRRTWAIGSVDQTAERLASKAEDPTEKKGVVGAFCRTFDVRKAIEEFLPGVYSEGRDGRLTFAAGTTENGVVIYGGGKWLFSHHGSDPAGGRLCNAFDLARIHRFGSLDEEVTPGTPAIRYPSYTAMSDLARSDPRVSIELHRDKLPEFETIEPGKEPETGWMAELSTTAKGAIKTTFLNCLLIIEHDPVLAGTVAKNLFSGALDHIKPLGPIAPRPDKAWPEDADGFVREYLERQWKLAFGPQVIRDAINGAAMKRAYHPVRDWLDSLKWDGKPRAERLFPEYLGSEDSRYTRAVGRKMLQAAYRRVFEPGAKFDFVVILEGLQGARKSTFWEVLARGWFTELATFEPKTAGEIIQGKWFVEIAELEPFSRFAQEQIKAFLSKRSDRYREAYAVRAFDRPRQCVFVGSTNADEYLQDRTGNRRYWPVKCSKSEADPIDTDRLAREIEQIWAEVASWAVLGESLYLDASEDREAAAREQRARLFSDEWEGRIGEWLSQPVAADRYEEGAAYGSEAQKLGPRDRVCVPEIFETCLGIELAKTDVKSRRRIGGALRSLGWQAGGAERFGKYGVQKSFRPPEGWVPF